jgi:beta-galactosidase GanA
METQPGFVNWSPVNTTLDKGEVRAMAWHDVCHGADAVSYWQWRSALNGQEELHGTHVGTDGAPSPSFRKLCRSAAKNLISYVRNGGHLVLGQRAAMKDDDNSLQGDRAPGPLTTLLGGRVEQFYAIDDKTEDTVPVTGKWGSTTSKIWAEQLSTSAPDTEVLIQYGKSNGWLDGQPAVITSNVGKGRITYIGAWMGRARHA